MPTNIVCLLVVLLGCCAFCNGQCPPSELIKPCFCNAGTVTCVGIVDMHVLHQVFDRSADYKFQNLNLFNSSVLYLPAEKVAFKKIQKITIENSSMSTLFDAEISEENDLIYLHAWSSVFQRGLGWNRMHNLKKLEYFGVDNTKVRALDKTFRDNISPRLSWLYLTKANIRKVHPTAFADLKDLSIISIASSPLKSVRRSWFAKPAALSYIDLSSTQLTSLPEDLFSDMPKLSTIMLNSNQLTSISETTFGSVYDQLFYLTMRGDPINCDCSIRWLMLKSKEKMKSLLHANCAYPDDKKGKSVPSLSYNEFKYCD